jgi:hypothetical protein
MNKSAQELGKIKSVRKSKTSAENGRKAGEIRARLTIYGHEEMSDKVVLNCNFKILFPSLG